MHGDPRKCVIADVIVADMAVEAWPALRLLRGELLFVFLTSVLVLDPDA